LPWMDGVSICFNWYKFKVWTLHWSRATLKLQVWRGPDKIATR
jgi:hypothetical protein